MKKVLAVSALALAVVGALAFASYGDPADRGRGPAYGYGHGPGYFNGPMGHGPGWMHGAMHFDPASLETITGKVAEVKTVKEYMPFAMKQIVVEADGKKTTVHLGPAFYLDAQKLKLKEGDSVKVEGTRVTFGQTAILVAKAVTRGDETLALRDEAGFPAWHGAGRGRFYGSFRGRPHGMGWGMMGPGYGMGMGMGYGMMGPGHGPSWPNPSEY